MVQEIYGCAILSDFARLLTISESVRGPFGRRELVQQLKFLAQSIVLRRSVSPMLNAPKGTVLERLMRERPEILGAVIWPYLCAEWEPDQRLQKISEHCEYLDRFSSPLEFSATEYLPLLSLEEISDGLHVVIDQPRWFMREGLLAISLFKNATRLFTLAFSFADEDGKTSALIGAVQGRNLGGVLQEYKMITKGSEGLRPRDLLLDLLRMLCVEIGVVRILGVSEESRHHRSSYFGYPADKEFSTNYNEIWEDRGGRRVNRAFYELDLAIPIKALPEISAKKRGMYRKRYLMLELINKRLKENLAVVGPRPLAGSID